VLTLPNLEIQSLKRAMQQNNYLKQMKGFITQAMIEHTSQDNL
jgi:hypothetical protein